MKFTRPYIYCVIPLDKDTGDEQDVLFWIQDETTLQSHKSLAENMAYATGQPSRIVRFKRDDVLEEILKDGFITKRYVNPTTMIGVIPLLYGRARLGKGDPRNSWFDETWDYETVDEAVVAASQWNPETQDEPPGKFEHLITAFPPKRQKGGRGGMTKEEILEGLKAGKKLCCDRKDEPLLPWLLAHPNIANSGVIQHDEQSSYIEFWWKES